jgi:hypothetical protein
MILLVFLRSGGMAEGWKSPGDVIRSCEPKEIDERLLVRVRILLSEK